MSTERSKVDDVAVADLLKSNSSNSNGGEHLPQVDLNALTRNIDRCLTLGERKKTDLLSPHELYRRAHPGLAPPTTMDVTDPREWYSTSAKKRVLKKLASGQSQAGNNKSSSTTTSATAANGNASSDDVTATASNQVAFYVSFPDIRQTSDVTAADVSETSRNRAHAKLSHEKNNKLLPELKTHASVGGDTSKPGATKEPKDSKSCESHIQIQHFIPSIEGDNANRFNQNNKNSARFQREKSSLLHRDVTSDSMTDRLGNVYYKYNKKPVTSPQRHTTPYQDANMTSQMQEKSTSHMNNLEIQIPVTSQPSARLNRQPTDMASMTSSIGQRGQPAKGSEKYPFPSVNSSLPVLPSGRKPEVSANDAMTSCEEDVSVTPQWQVASGDVKSVAQMAAELVRLNRVASHESLLTPTGSRDKYLQLRIPQHRAEIDDMHYFRDTYSLRQRSNLKLTSSNNTNATTSQQQAQEKRKTALKISKGLKAGEEEGKRGVGDGGSSHEVQSIVGQYIHSRQPTQFIVVPDSRGDPEAVALDEKNVNPEVKSKTITRGKTSSSSDIQKDVSSETHTLGERTPKRVKSPQLPQNKPEVSDIEVNQPKRSARSPKSKPVTLKPEQDATKAHQLPVQPPPASLACMKPFYPMKPKKSRQKYMAMSDSALNTVGRRETTVFDLAMTERKPPTRRKTLVRAIDKYIEEKLGEKLRKKQEEAVKKLIQDQNSTSSQNATKHIEESRKTMHKKSLSHPLLQQNTRVKVQHPLPLSKEEQRKYKGKRFLYTRGKTTVGPFQEQGSDVKKEEMPKSPKKSTSETRHKSDSDVMLESILSDKRNYNAQLRPPSFRLDMRHYPPSRPSISRDASFDQRKNTIIIHRAADQKLGEYAVKFPSRRTSAATQRPGCDGESRYTRSETTPSLPPGNDRPFRRRRRRRAHGGAGYIELHVVNKHMPFQLHLHRAPAAADSQTTVSNKTFDLDSSLCNHDVEF